MCGYLLLHMFYPAECPVITPEHCQHTTGAHTSGLPPPHKHAALPIYSHTPRTSSLRFLLISCMSPWRPSLHLLLLLLLHFYFSRSPPPPPPPPPGFSPVPLFAGDCCFRGGCGGESSSLQGRDGEREKGQRFVKCLYHFSIGRPVASPQARLRLSYKGIHCSRDKMSRQNFSPNRRSHITWRIQKHSDEAKTLRLNFSQVMNKNSELRENRVTQALLLTQINWCK